MQLVLLIFMRRMRIMVSDRCGPTLREDDRLFDIVVGIPFARAKIRGVGIATPPTSYSHMELPDIFGVKDRRVWSLFFKQWHQSPTPLSPSDP